ncbi:ASCH domain-containing protein [Sporomusa termitida]|uniref:ASCH domain-containing protein n=1 Tax=Sporomusa termitida TaxID=2377 RepID=A0A517DR67_9FIRM|nr:ASCH domain-containing protein [Sporomusa termitida]QDR79817.1 hypothetical protein SPTER_11180 [Sporomusa termitida]
MKAITILEPWASLIACGAKQIETRNWSTKYRGRIAIHAGKETKRAFYSLPIITALGVSCVSEHWLNIRLGSVIAITNLVDCLQVRGTSSLKICNEQRVAAILENNMRVMGNELEFGDYTHGRYAWILANVRRIEPVPAKGRQRLWEWEAPSGDHC